MCSSVQCWQGRVRFCFVTAVYCRVPRRQSVVMRRKGNAEQRVALSCGVRARCGLVRFGDGKAEQRNVAQRVGKVKLGMVKAPHGRVRCGAGRLNRGNIPLTHPEWKGYISRTIECVRYHLILYDFLPHKSMPTMRNRSRPRAGG